MHICFLTNEYPPAPHGGIGSFVQSLARALVRSGHRVTVIGLYAPPYVGEFEDEGVHLINLPHSRLPKMSFVPNSLAIQKALYKLHRQHPIDILEAQEAGFAFFPRKSPWMKLVRMHGGHHYYAVTLGKKPRFWRAFQEKRSFAVADALCAASAVLAETTRRLTGVQKPIEVIPNMVNTDLFSPREEVSEREGLIVFVGALVAKKGIYFLVEAMPKILEAFPNAELCVIGRDTISPLSGVSVKEELLSRVSESVQTHIKFTGAIPNEEIPNMLAQAQVAAYPSHMEAFGIVFIEAMAMGKAVVVGETGAGSEIVQHGETGLLCNPIDSASIAEQIIRLLNDKALREKLGQAARERVVSHYALDVITKQNEAFYTKLIQVRNN